MTKGSTEPEKNYHLALLQGKTGKACFIVVEGSMRTSSKRSTDAVPLRSITVFSKQVSTEPSSVVRAHALTSCMKKP